MKRIIFPERVYYGIVKDEQWNYHLGKMYGCVCVCVLSKISMPTNVPYNVRYKAYI